MRLVLGEMHGMPGHGSSQTLRRPRARRANARPRHRLAALSAAIVALAFAVASAQAFSPPAGTPDLAKMTLQPSDLAPGAQVLVSAYFDPGVGLKLRAEYDRDFGVASTKTGVKFAQIQTTITLANSTSFAKTVFAQLQPLYGANTGRAGLVAQVRPFSGKGSGATLKDATFGKLASIGVGQQSLFESATIRSQGATLVAGFVWIRVDDAVAFLAIVAAKPSLSNAVPIALATAVAAHMKSVLAGKTASAKATRARLAQHPR